MVAGACNPSYLGGWGRRIGWIEEAEVGLNQDHHTALIGYTFICEGLKKKTSHWPGAVAHVCNPSTLGGWGGRIAWTQEVEVAVSRDCAIALQPGAWQQSLCLKKKKTRHRQETRLRMLTHSFGLYRKHADHLPFPRHCCRYLGHSMNKQISQSHGAYILVEVK